MSDKKLRDLERRARQGDPEAKRQLKALRQRVCEHPPDRKYWHTENKKYYESDFEYLEYVEHTLVCGKCDDRLEKESHDYELFYPSCPICFSGE